MKKRIVVITHGIPHPSKGASRVLFYWYIKALKSNGNTIIHLVIDTVRDNADKELSEYTNAIGVGSEFLVIHEVFPLTYAFSYKKFAIEPQLPTDHTISEIKNFDAHVIVCFDILASAVAKNLGFTNLLIWLGDLTYQTAMYHAVYDIRSNLAKIFLLPRVLLNCIVWKKLYRSTLNGQANVIVSSKSSEKLIDVLGVHAKYLPYPWPSVNLERKARVKYTLPTFIMFGTLGALGSKSAFYFLLKKVYPLLVQKWGKNGFKILIAGSHDMPEWVHTEVVAHTGLKYIGFVEDLASLVDQCHAVLAPIAVPVGNRSRIVTAMSMGSVIIAHKNTALGNPELVSGENCFLAESEKDYVMFMQRAYDLPTEAEKIGRAARSKYLETFEPGVASPLLLQTFDFTNIGGSTILS